MIDPAEHIDMARGVALGMARNMPRWVDRDEMVSAALLGLCEAAERYDEGSDTPFQVYARWRVRGAVVDHLRKSSAFVRRRAARRTGDDIVLSLDALLDEHEDSREYIDLVAEEAQYEPEQQVLVAERSRELAGAINDPVVLNDRERMIVAGYSRHVHGQAIADDLGVHPSRVSQIRGVALDRLHGHLTHQAGLAKLRGLVASA